MEDKSMIGDEIKKLLEASNLVSNDQYVQKVVELYETIQTHQGIVLLGKSFSGKTKAYQVSGWYETGVKDLSINELKLKDTGGLQTKSWRIL